MGATETTAVIEAVWRIESTRLVAALARVVRDLDQAEEFAHDALVAALETWPRDGVPANPGAWLMATAKHRAIDQARRLRTRDDRYREVGRELEQRQRDLPDLVAELQAAEFGGDDVLRLVFTTCHPVLSTEARVALTLRLVGGLATDEIARAFVVPEPTIGQRISRAKQKLRGEGVAFEVPSGAELEERLASVLEVVYLVFNEGYSATSGDDWTRPELCQDALRLGRILARLAPGESEVHGLVALMELQASRLRARLGPGGEPVLLLDQQRSRWDHLLVRRGLDALARAEATAPNAVLGPYALQASIAACHARAATAEETDWARIAAIYGILAARVPTPIVELNRAVAVSMAHGPAPALQLVDALVEDGRLATYHLLPSVRGDLLARLDRHDEARVEFERAAKLVRNEAERAMLLARAATTR